MTEELVTAAFEGRGITAVSGFQAAGISAGLKNGKKDLALLYSERQTVAAGVFTRNLVQAAPVRLCRERLCNPVQAVVINSGNANACTGAQGYLDATEMAALTASRLNLEAGQVLVGSTGVIGQPLPMGKIRAGIDPLVSSLGQGENHDSAAAKAIMTTDTVIKQAAYRCSLPGGGEFHLAGIAKGSGMICPNMATMLAFLVTDASVERKILQDMLQDAADQSFNVITVDGETSTNDTALLLANGAAEGAEITEGSGFKEPFQALLNLVCRDLAYKIVADGEGLTKVINLTVRGAAEESQGRVLARSVLNSPLVKTAFYGEDANWGRILAALGYAGVPFDPEKVDIFIGPYQVAADGGAVPFSEEKVLQVLKQRDVPVIVDLKDGPCQIEAWGTDMSHEYVTINSHYRS